MSEELLTLRLTRQQAAIVIDAMVFRNRGEDDGWNHVGLTAEQLAARMRERWAVRDKCAAELELDRTRPLDERERKAIDDMATRQHRATCRAWVSCEDGDWWEAFHASRMTADELKEGRR